MSIGRQTKQHQQKCSIIYLAALILERQAISHERVTIDTIQ